MPCNSQMMLLKLYVENPDLRDKYLDSILEHNQSLENNAYYNAGFDLFVSQNENVPYGRTTILDSRVKCSAFWLNDDMTIGDPTGFYLHPRSSIIKTPLRIANSTGIIDAGYRGLICAAVDNTSNEPYTIRGGQRLFQLCSPTLSPISFELSNRLSDSSRGEGGFGSTGIK